MPLADWAWLLAMLAGCGVLVALGRRIEPHWSTPDGSSFSCFVQRVAADGATTGRWRQGRAELVGDHVRMRQRVFAGFSRHVDTLRVVARGESNRRAKRVFLLESTEPDGGYVALRIPEHSPTVRLLDDLTH